ncbi:2018_t:CDS:2, partial [Funneliformis geosporum]
IQEIVYSEYWDSEYQVFGMSEFRIQEIRIREISTQEIEFQDISIQEYRCFAFGNLSDKVFQHINTTAKTSNVITNDEELEGFKHENIQEKDVNLQSAIDNINKL